MLRCVSRIGRGLDPEVLGPKAQELPVQISIEADDKLETLFSTRTRC